MKHPFEESPKEKAKELYCNYTDALIIRDLQTTANPFAKKCALIAVDEILSMGIMSDSGDWKMAKLYWQEVKQEIEKL
jgi:hypothetical protein